MLHGAKLELIIFSPIFFRAVSPSDHFQRQNSAIFTYTTFSMAFDWMQFPWTVLCEGGGGWRCCAEQRNIPNRIQTVSLS